MISWVNIYLAYSFIVQWEEFYAMAIFILKNNAESSCEYTTENSKVFLKVNGLTN